MLITLSIANDTFKIANHYTDPTATYVSSLSINNISTKKGIATDSFKFSIEKAVLDHLGEAFAYICYDTTIDLYIDNLLIVKGYVNDISTTSKKIVELGVNSIMSWQLQQFVSPSVSGLCQNQTYSENCGLIAADFAYTFGAVQLDCFTGSATLDIDQTGELITLGGDAVALGAFNPLFLTRENWWNAIVIINGKYRTNIVNVSDTKVFFGINYLDASVTTVSITIYIKCDKTYGQCYSRFSNTPNFWGFANTGRKVQTFDIFSASALTYCGEELVDQDFEFCATDFSIFGVNLNG